MSFLHDISDWVVINCDEPVLLDRIGPILLVGPASLAQQVRTLSNGTALFEHPPVLYILPGCDADLVFGILIILMGFQVQQRKRDKDGEKKLKGETNEVWTDSSTTRKPRGTSSINVQRETYESALAPKVGGWMYEKHPADV
ncbi:hypothetical protein BDZ91DRAFT_767998 [Kalaharituber pfeilii]|nr:hypothetical protein BDZ91DRAFT_767998 [Kalaharituber pfeilii]